MISIANVVKYLLGEKAKTEQANKLLDEKQSETCRSCNVSLAPTKAMISHSGGIYCEICIINNKPIKTMFEAITKLAMTYIAP